MKKNASRFLFAALFLLGGNAFPLATYAGGHCHGGHSHGHSGGHGHSHGSYHYHSYRSPRMHMRGGGGGYSDGLQQPLRHVSGLSAGIGAPDQVMADYPTIYGFSPNYNISFRYQLNDWLALDLTAGMQQHLTGNDTCNCTPGQSLGYKYDISTYRFAAGVSIIYFSGDRYQLYGGAQAGIAYYNETDNYADHTTETVRKYKPTGQLTLLGFRYGRKLGVFAEFGLGCKGLFNAGISYQPNLKRY